MDNGSVISLVQLGNFCIGMAHVLGLAQAHFFQKLKEILLEDFVIILVV